MAGIVFGISDEDDNDVLQVKESFNAEEKGNITLQNNFGNAYDQGEEGEEDNVDAVKGNRSLPPPTIIRNRLNLFRPTLKRRGGVNGYCQGVPKSRRKGRCHSSIYTANGNNLLFKPPLKPSPAGRGNDGQ
jgi:hypothetical protein